MTIRAPGLVALLAVLAGCSRQASPPPAPLPSPAPGPAPGESVLEVRPSRPRRETSCVGDLRAVRTTRLGAQVSGRVAEVLVEEGTAVAARQELVRLDTSTFALEIAVREAERDAAAVANADAQLQFGRVRALWERPGGDEPSIPRKQFDDARARADAAEVQVRLAEAALRLARQKLDDAVIRAPFDGVVTRRLVDPGQPVTAAPATELLEVRDLSSLDLEYRLPQALLSRISPATPVEWSIEGVPAADGNGTVSVILPDLDEATRTFRCRTRLSNAAGHLRPGLLARVRVIETSPREALFIPAVALLTSAGGPAVRILDSGVPALRTVVPGVVWGNQVEIVRGLSPGDRLLIPGPR